MSDARRMWDSAIAAAEAITKSPMYQAYIRSLQREAAERRRIQDEEERVAREAREAAEEKKRRDRLYDMTGGHNECYTFGSWNGCAPHCPMFARGDCPIQDENEFNFAEAALPTAPQAQGERS